MTRSLAAFYEATGARQVRLPMFRRSEWPTSSGEGTLVDVEPLDEQQQQYLAALRQGVTIDSRRGAFVYGFCVGGAMLGGLMLGFGVAAGGGWPVLSVGALLLAGACGALAAYVGPEGILHYLVRSQMPSKASLDKGISSFQIDGGRAWKIGEKPPPKYWDTWK